MSWCYPLKVAKRGPQRGWLVAGIFPWEAVGSGETRVKSQESRVKRQESGVGGQGPGGGGQQSRVAPFWCLQSPGPYSFLQRPASSLQSPAFFPLATASESPASSLRPSYPWPLTSGPWFLLPSPRPPVSGLRSPAFLSLLSSCPLPTPHSRLPTAYRLLPSCLTNVQIPLGSVAIGRG